MNYNDTTTRFEITTKKPLPFRRVIKNHMLLLAMNHILAVTVLLELLQERQNVTALDLGHVPQHDAPLAKEENLPRLSVDLVLRHGPYNVRKILDLLRHVQVLLPQPVDQLFEVVLVRGGESDRGIFPGRFLFRDGPRGSLFYLKRRYVIGLRFGR